MGAMASQITSLTIVYSTVYSGADQSKHQSSASLAFVCGIHRGPVNSPHKWPVTRKMFPFDYVIMFMGSNYDEHPCSNVDMLCMFVDIPCNNTCTCQKWPLSVKCQCIMNNCMPLFYQILSKPAKHIPNPFNINFKHIACWSFNDICVSYFCRYLRLSSKVSYSHTLPSQTLPSSVYRTLKLENYPGPMSSLSQRSRSLGRRSQSLLPVNLFCAALHCIHSKSLTE